MPIPERHDFDIHSMERVEFYIAEIDSNAYINNDHSPSKKSLVI